MFLPKLTILFSNQRQTLFPAAYFRGFSWLKGLCMSCPDVWGPPSYKNLMAFCGLFGIEAKLSQKRLYFISKCKLYIMMPTFVDFRG